MQHNIRIESIFRCSHYILQVSSSFALANYFHQSFEPKGLYEYFVSLNVCSTTISTKANVAAQYWM